VTLDALVEDPWFRNHVVYYVGERGPVRRRLAQLPHYTESRYTPEVTLGTVVGDRATVQDLQQLTFADESFDLVVSSHVMEHVPDPWKALSEIRRVLRPGGRYVFSVPFRRVVLRETLVRAVVDGGDVRHLLDPIYHDAPDGRSLVFHEFGADLVERGEAVGLSVRVVRPHLPVQLANRDVVVVASPLT
jgi:SAM-dependent methyltransferase